MSLHNNTRASVQLIGWGWRWGLGLGCGSTGINEMNKGNRAQSTATVTIVRSQSGLSLSKPGYFHICLRAAQPSRT